MSAWWATSVSSALTRLRDASAVISQGDLDTVSTHHCITARPSQSPVKLMPDAFDTFNRKYGELQSDGSYEVPARWQAGLSNGVQCGEIIGLFSTLVPLSFKMIAHFSQRIRVGAVWVPLHCHDLSCFLDRSHRHLLHCPEH